MLFLTCTAAAVSVVLALLVVAATAVEMNNQDEEETVSIEGQQITEPETAMRYSVSFTSISPISCSHLSTLCQLCSHSRSHHCHPFQLSCVSLLVAMLCSLYQLDSGRDNVQDLPSRFPSSTLSWSLKLSSLGVLLRSGGVCWNASLFSKTSINSHRYAQAHPPVVSTASARSPCAGW